MAITPTIAVYDLDVTDPDSDATLLATWKSTLGTLTHIYGWSVTPLGNSRLRYTVVYD